MHYNELLSNTGGHDIRDVVDIMNYIASLEESYWGLVYDTGICFSFAVVIILRYQMSIHLDETMAHSSYRVLLIK